MERTRLQWGEDLEQVSPVAGDETVVQPPHASNPTVDWPVKPELESRLFIVSSEGEPRTLYNDVIASRESMLTYHDRHRE